MQGHHHGHRFNDIDRLRSPERLARLEVDHVVGLALAGADMHTVLDIGTGTGIFAEAFNRRGKQVTGVDVNPDMLAAASRYVPEGIFQPAAAEDLPFPNDSFDLVFMGLVLHETDDLLQSLREAYRVTRRAFAVLEWPYEEQDFGPGLEERLQPDQMMQLAVTSGFFPRETDRLEQLVLYRFDKGMTNSTETGHDI